MVSVYFEYWAISESASGILFTLYALLITVIWPKVFSVLYKIRENVEYRFYLCLYGDGFIFFTVEYFLLSSNDSISKGGLYPINFIIMIILACVTLYQQVKYRKELNWENDDGLMFSMKISTHYKFFAPVLIIVISLAIICVLKSVEAIFFSLLLPYVFFPRLGLVFQKRKSSRNRESFKYGLYCVSIYLFMMVIYMCILLLSVNSSAILTVFSAFWLLAGLMKTVIFFPFQLQKSY